MKLIPLIIVLFCTTGVALPSSKANTWHGFWKAQAESTGCLKQFLKAHGKPIWTFWGKNGKRRLEHWSVSWKNNFIFKRQMETERLDIAPGHRNMTTLPAKRPHWIYCPAWQCALKSSQSCDDLNQISHGYFGKVFIMKNLIREDKQCSN